MEITADYLRQISKQKILSFTFNDNNGEISMAEEYNNLLLEIANTASHGYTNHLYYPRHEGDNAEVIFQLILRLLKLDGFEITCFKDEAGIVSIVNIGW